jgi:hypothetical protein
MQNINIKKAMVWYSFQDLSTFLQLGERTLIQYHEAGVVDRMSVPGGMAILGSLYGIPLALFASIANGNTTSVRSYSKRLRISSDIVHLIPTHLSNQSEIAVPRFRNLPALSVGKRTGKIRAKNKSYQSMPQIERVDEMPTVFARNEVNALFQSMSNPDITVSTEHLSLEDKPKPTKISTLPPEIQAFLKRTILASTIDEVREDAYNLLHPSI